MIYVDSAKVAAHIVMERVGMWQRERLPVHELKPSSGIVSVVRGLGFLGVRCQRLEGAWGREGEWTVGPAPLLRLAA